MTEMLSASGGFATLTPDQGLCSWTPLGALPPDPHYRLVLRTRHGAPPQPLTPSAAYESNWTLPRYLKPKVGAYALWWENLDRMRSFLSTYESASQIGLRSVHPFLHSA